jgi:uncharacterized membrane protein
MSDSKTTKHSASRYFITGILTIIPIWITILVFQFLFTQLSRIGTPGVQKLATLFQDPPPAWILAEDSWFLAALAAIFTLLVIYLIGWMAHQFIGRQLLNAFDAIMNRLPFIQTVYGSTKKLLGVLQQKPGETQRVVLIDFPSPEMKTVGFVTQVLTDDNTGQKVAAVYVPTTPNPTSGYLEIVPLDRIISTNWTMDQAMTFIISGGAVAPDNFNYTNGASSN